MAVRILLRRDTASNWVLNNPILLSGEIGIESDTNKFKIGNGSRWNAITSYAFKPGEPNGIATLNSAGKIPTSQLPDQVSVSGEVAAAIAALTTTSLTEGTNKYFTDARAIAANASIIANAITTAAADATAKANAAEENAIDTASADATLKANTAETNAIADAETKIAAAKSQAISAASNDATSKVNAALTDIAEDIEAAINVEIGARNTAISTAISAEIINRNTAIEAEIMALTTSDIPEGTNKYFTDQRAKDAVAADIQAAIDAIPVDSGGQVIASTTNLPEGTNLYFTNARAITALTPTINNRVAALQSADDELRTFLMDMISDTNSDVTTIENSLGEYVLDATRNQQNGYAGLDSNTKLLESVIPDSIATKQYADAAVAALVGNAPEALNTIAELSAALGNDDSAIDALTTLIGTKLSSHTAETTYETITNVALKAPIESPTFTGTVSGITASMVGLANVDNTADMDKPVSTAMLSALDLKAPLSNPIFTGTVDFTTATVTGIDALPLQVNNSGKYLKTDGTSATWETLDLTLYATLEAPTFTGTVTFNSAPIVPDNSFQLSAINGVVNSKLPISYLEYDYITINGTNKQLGSSFDTPGYLNSSNTSGQNQIAYGTSETPSIVSPVAGDIYIQY